MKKSLFALTALFALSAICCAPTFATSTARGSLVLVPPLVKKGDTKSNRPLTVMRLPTQAGKVSKMVTTNLVANSPSWIAKGDKYYSLCVPNRRMVACAPIVATSVMQGIEVGAYADPKRGPLVTFKIAAGTKLSSRRIVYAIQYFLARTNKQVAHFNRMAVSYAPRSGQASLRVGSTSNYSDAGGGGGGCSYDDDNSYDCTGGDSGGGGYDGGRYGGYGDNGGSEDPVTGPASTPNEPTGQCDGNCNYPPSENNGNPDPCVDGNGDACPVVIITGERPSDVEPTSLPTCTAGPGAIECHTPPPVVGGEPTELPKGPMPWFPQSWCNFWSVFCSAGQEPEPDNDRGSDSSTSGKSLSQLYDICEAIEGVERDVCRANRANMDNRMLQVCFDKARDRKLACYSTARSLTNKGANLAP